MTPLRGTALTQGVDVSDPAQVVEGQLLPGLRRFPDRPLGRLAVANQNVRTVLRTQSASIQGDTDRRTDALSE